MKLPLWRDRSGSGGYGEESPLTGSGREHALAIPLESGRWIIIVHHARRRPRDTPQIRIICAPRRRARRRASPCSRPTAAWRRRWRANSTRRRRRKGRARWESADILPYAAFVERCYEDALYSELRAASADPADAGAGAGAVGGHRAALRGGRCAARDSRDRGACGGRVAQRPRLAPARQPALGRAERGCSRVSRLVRAVFAALRTRAPHRRGAAAGSGRSARWATRRCAGRRCSCSTAST